MRLARILNIPVNLDKVEPTSPKQKKKQQEGSKANVHAGSDGKGVGEHVEISPKSIASALAAGEATVGTVGAGTFVLEGQNTEEKSVSAAQQKTSQEKTPKKQSYTIGGAKNLASSTTGAVGDAPVRKTKMTSNSTSNTEDLLRSLAPGQASHSLNDASVSVVGLRDTVAVPTPTSAVSDTNGASARRYVLAATILQSTKMDKN